MTVPGGVPNLPTGALTIDTLASATQDTSPEAMKSRAVDRFSSIFDNSTGGSPANDLTPYGVIVKLFSGFNSLVANADPADIRGPEDLPQLLVNFVESLPLVGQFIDLFDAIGGTYDGDDETLLAIQEFFRDTKAAIDQAEAKADAAADKWAQAVDGLLGNGHGVEDFINMLQGLRDGNLNVLTPAGANRLDNPNFNGALSIQDPNGDFVWDATVSRSAGAGSGSARATADGTEKELWSNKVPVAAGQVWTFIANLGSVGLAGAGQLVQLTALPFDKDDNELPPVVLTGVGVPTGSGVWTSPPAGANKTAQLTSDWTVPANVTRVALRMVLTETATGGTIWLDDMSVAAKNPIPQDWVKNLVADLNTTFTRFAQMGEIVSGQIITAYDDFVQDFKDYWTSNFGPAALKAKADQNAAWATRKAQNDQILNDWSFPPVYAFGSPSDTAATLVNGKPTKWGAWNDNWKIVGEQTGIIPSTVPLVDLGAKVSDNETATQLAAATASAAGAAASLAQATNQDLTNKIVASQTGVEPSTGTAADAYDALTNIPASNIQGQQGATVTFGAASGVVSNTGGFSGTLSTNLTFTPLSTDTQVDVIVAFKGGDFSTRTISCTRGGVAQTQVIRYAGTAYGGNVPEIAVFRVPVTPTANPSQMTFTINVTSSNGNSQMSAIAVSYAGVKANYFAGTSGALAGGANTITQQRNSDPGRRLFQVVHTVVSNTPTIASASGGSVKANFGDGGTQPRLFVQDQAASAAPGGVTTLSATATLLSGAQGQYASVIVEISN